MIDLILVRIRIRQNLDITMINALMRKPPNWQNANNILFSFLHRFTKKTLKFKCNEQLSGNFFFGIFMICMKQRLVIEEQI